MKKVEILADILIAGEPVSKGTILEIDDVSYNVLISYKLVKLYEELEPTDADQDKTITKRRKK